jgi:hypothetical protein
MIDQIDNAVQLVIPIHDVLEAFIPTAMIPPNTSQVIAAWVKRRSENRLR